ncbi:hypothetical protein [Robiginitalea sp. IMCC43444]|uniref:hypothetical protein n=1 Tax=Robiginitalea sp. IMCC43444 TaxID=3459121 RepID=UPI0040424172
MRIKYLCYALTVLLVLSCNEEPSSEELYSDNPVPEVSLFEESIDLDPETQAYNWLKSMQHSNGLVESAYNTNFVSLYDNALAALAFMEMGDYPRAKNILDYFRAIQPAEFASSGGGFYQFRDTEGTNASRVWLGDNAWLLIALRHYKQLSGSQDYNEMITILDSWIRTLQTEDGALSGGINEDGSEIPKVTEGILTAFTAVEGFDAFHQGILTFLQTHRWDTQQAILKTHSYEAPYAHAMDLHSLPAMIFKADASLFLDSADRFFTVQQHTVNQLTLGGFCFDEDLDVVWLEGTAQMALAYRYSGMSEAYEMAVGELEKSFVSKQDGSGLQGLPYTANHGTNFGATPLWDHADEKGAVSSTAWYLFAKSGFNPLQLSNPGAPDSFLVQ